MKRYLLAALCFSSLAAVAADNATLMKDDSLRSKPFLDAPSQATLSRGSSVSIIKKQGAWANVKQGSKTGWVRSLSLKTGAAALPSSTLAQTNTGRLGTGKIVTTTGIRGLEADGSTASLETAQFNAEELAAAEALTVSADKAKAFAKSGKLTVHSVNWLTQGAAQHE